MKYLFSCRHCGEYPVAGKTFLSFLTPKLRHLVKKISGEKGKDLILEFLSRSCPRCRPEGSATGIVKIRHKKTAKKGGSVERPSWPL